MEPAGIVLVTRAAAFIAQLAHESGEFRFMIEEASGEAYEGRKNLGNTSPGDGKKYKGRGWIQLTGKDNYFLAGAAIGQDLVNIPDLAAQPVIAAKVAVWYWLRHQLNVLADAGDFAGITRAINGGLNGIENRVAYYHRALEVLGAQARLP